MTFLRKLFGREKAPPSIASQALTMVMLRDDVALDGAAALDHLTAHWSDLPPVTGRQASGAVTAASIPGGAVGIAHMPVPIPMEGLEGPAALAWHWPGAVGEVGAHRSHVIVHAGSSTLDAVDLRLLLTRLTASVVAVSNAAGVYVGEAMLVRSAVDYSADAAEAARDNLPILSWVAFNPVRDDEGGTLSVYTTGLSAFGLHELEVHGDDRPAAELLGMLADIAHYQLASGKVLRDGDTFGASETDRTRIRYRPSSYIPDMEVAAIEL